MIFHFLPLFALAAILPSGSGQTAAQISTFQNAMLVKTNELRALHGSPPVIHETPDNNTAQQWAEHLALIDDMVHSDSSVRGKTGENLYYSYSSSKTFMATGEEATQYWYDEIAHYQWFGGEPNMSTFHKYAHFTALVWKSVEKIDVGFKKSASNRWYVVCRYSPTANIIGQFGQNVPAPL